MEGDNPNPTMDNGKIMEEDTNNDTNYGMAMSPINSTAMDTETTTTEVTDMSLDKLAHMKNFGVTSGRLMNVMLRNGNLGFKPWKSR